jgi:hypothetical protein
VDLIDQIEETRAANNNAWMRLLRLAIEARPEEAKEIVDEIRQHDRQIMKLLEALVSD